MKRSSSSSLHRNEHVKTLKIDRVQDYFSHPRAFANLKIVLDQQTLWCDKASLSAASPVLREQLLKLNPSDPTLTFHDIHLDDFLLMLEFIYPMFNPEITDENISSLIELSYRFEFDILKYACQTYVMKYLSQIRRVFVHHLQIEETDDDHRTTSDLIEFSNQTRFDALKITKILCQWLKVFYSDANRLPRQTIMSVLQQISVDYLDKAMIDLELNDAIKSFIYKERAQYLERMASIR